MSKAVSVLNSFWRWLGTPFRAIVTLTFQQIRSLFSIAMLAGIISLSIENWALIAIAHHAVEAKEVSGEFFGLLVERTRYNSGLQGFFAFIMGLIVFGAEYFHLKWGDKEAKAGREPKE